MRSRTFCKSGLEIRVRWLIARAAILIPLGLISSCSHDATKSEVDRNPRFDGSPLIRKTIRKIFPYSLIPGGVNDAAAFQSYRVSDSVLLQHFRDMGRNIRKTAFPGDKWMYSSYRVGDKVYWTKNRILIHAGEALLTDGNNLVRGRCGNRISGTPGRPVQAAEPASITTDIPNTEIVETTPPDLIPQVDVVGPVDFPEVTPPAPTDTSSVPIPPQTPGIEFPPQPTSLPPDTSPSMVFFPPTPFPPVGVPPGPPPHRASPPPEVPAITTPEVSSWILMVTGLLILGLTFVYRTRTAAMKMNSVSLTGGCHGRRDQK